MNEAIEIEDAVEGTDNGELTDDAIPRPVGYTILVALLDVDEKYRDSVIAKADQTKRHDSILAMVGAVVDVSPHAYTDKQRYPDGPWCKQGDYVMFRPNSGTRFRVAGREMRLIMEDTIQAVVPDPRSIERV